MTRTSDDSLALTLRIFVSVLLIFQTVNATQLLEQDLHKMIGTPAWSTEELASLHKGDVVVRQLQTGDKQEIASIGLLRMRNLRQISMPEFRDSLSQNGSDEKRAGGRFSEPPTIEDLGSLELEKETIEKLRKCSVRKCDLNLSAEMITRIHREIDWNSPNANTYATQLLGEMLLAYVQGYLARGDSSLGEYNNRRTPVDLAASHRVLLSTSSLISSLAPEFLDYLEKFPAATIENVENKMQWNTVDFGLKPSINISHTSWYTQGQGDNAQLFIASKQIYSSRYLDSSLTFTLLLRVKSETGHDAYLVFINRSRSDALDGPLGGLARRLVQNEAMERIKLLLSKAELRLLATGRSEKHESESGDGEDSWIDWISRQRIILLAGGVLAVALIFAIWRRRR